MSGSYASRLRSGGGSGVGAGVGGLGTTTALAAKVVFASAAVAAAASLARGLAVPQLVVSVAAGADAFLWKLYLFVAVHVIIFVIWKLSDGKHFHHKDPWVDEDGGVKRKEDFVSVSGADALQAGLARRKDSRAAPAAARGPPPRPVSAELVVPGFAPKEDFFSSGYGVPPLQKFSPKEDVVSPDSGVGESCVTTTEYEEADDSSSSAAADEWRSMAPAPLQRADLSLPLPPPTVAAAAMDHCFDATAGDGGDDDLDATWNAIMQKKRPSTAPASSTPPAPQAPAPPPAAARPRAREPSVGAAELSKRADDFIKKIHHSFGRQQ